MKTNNFKGDLTDISTGKEPLVTTTVDQDSCSKRLACFH